MFPSSSLSEIKTTNTRYTSQGSENSIYAFIPLTGYRKACVLHRVSSLASEIPHHSLGFYKNTLLLPHSPNAGSWQPQQKKELSVVAFETQKDQNRNPDCSSIYQEPWTTY